MYKLVQVDHVKWNPDACIKNTYKLYAIQIEFPGDNKTKYAKGIPGQTWFNWHMKFDTTGVKACRCKPGIPLLVDPQSHQRTFPEKHTY